MQTDILFGIHSEDMEEIKVVIEEILGRELEAREGFNWGHYYCLPFPERYLYLRYNEDNEDGEVMEHNFPDYPLLLYIYDAYRHPNYLTAVEARSDIFIELRTKRWDPKD
ncbi:hypothetical protein [Phyllobacterium bourgognense]|uniref:Uncharacterized protein n=1 Tax=Phyllobacterium bourgognense TaxID=314236 RepID=A0A368YH25_9HYPH|nr:hypothetical protein [Phyllobacterium bourgognense]RCW79533.1 hypothetical protein C7476_11748 [Phyllobacterium bourgognense]